jgi:hypothetical protein
VRWWVQRSDGIRALAELAIGIAVVVGFALALDNPYSSTHWRVALAVWLGGLALILFGLQLLRTGARLIVEGLAGVAIPLYAITTLPRGSGGAGVAITGVLLITLTLSLRAYRTKGKWIALFMGTVVIMILAVVVGGAAVDRTEPGGVRLLAAAVLAVAVVPAVWAYSAIFLQLARSLVLQLVIVGTVVLGLAGPGSLERQILLLGMFVITLWGIVAVIAWFDDGPSIHDLPGLGRAEYVFSALAGGAGAAFGSVVYMAFFTLSGIHWSWPEELRKVAVGVGASMVIQGAREHGSATIATGKGILRFGRFQILGGIAAFGYSLFEQMGTRVVEMTFSSQHFQTTWIIVAPLAGIVTYAWARGTAGWPHSASNGLIAGVVASGFVAGPLYLGVSWYFGGKPPDPGLVTRAFIWPIYGLIGGMAIDRDRRVGVVPPIALGLAVAMVVETLRLAVFYRELSGFPALLAFGWAAGLMARPVGRRVQPIEPPAAAEVERVR